MWTACAIVVAMNLGAIPELTEAQQIQLATADDARLPDEPAWTGLLTSVATWDPAEAAAGFLPGATVPDFEKLLAEPAAQRGGLFVLEGRYAGRQREMRTLRAGPWGETLKEWGVGVGESAGGEPIIAVVYLVDPEGQVAPPRAGQTVRLAARFYKLWTEVDAEGVERTYPVFVGRSASVVGNAAGGGTASPVIVGGIVVMAGLLGLVLMIRARSGRGASRRERELERLRREAEAWGDDAGMEDAGDERLSDDPATALEQLERSRGVGGVSERR